MLTNSDSQSPLSEINVTPLVDVMLVLLVIFMVTAPLLMQSVDVQLPKTAATRPAVEPQRAVLAINSAGALFLDGHEVAGDAIEAMLAAAARNAPAYQLTLQADERVPFGAVARALAASERAGVTRIAVMTVPRSAE
jgi:biopolymer transport protein ExbD